MESHSAASTQLYRCRPHQLTIQRPHHCVSHISFECSAALDLLDSCSSSGTPSTCFRLPPLLFPLSSLSSALLLLPASPPPTAPSIILNHALLDDSDGFTQLYVTVSTGTRAAMSAIVLQEVIAAEQVPCSHIVHRRQCVTLLLFRAFPSTCSRRRRAWTRSPHPHGRPAAAAGPLLLSPFLYVPILIPRSHRANLHRLAHVRTHRLSASPPSTIPFRTAKNSRENHRRRCSCSPFMLLLQPW